VSVAFSVTVVAFAQQPRNENLATGQTHRPNTRPG
jgi:hypothetical protein